MKRSTLLVLALVAAAGWAAWNARTPDAPAGADAPATRSTARKGRDVVTSEKVPVVVSDLALPGSGELFERERNLFEYAESPEDVARVEAQRRLAAEEAKRRAEEAAARAAEQAERDRVEREKRAEADRERARLRALEPPPPPTPPSFPYQYVGTIGPTDDPYAVLVGPDRANRFVRAGETIDGDFRIESIWRERLDVSYTDTRFADQFAQVQRMTDKVASTR